MATQSSAQAPSSRQFAGQSSHHDHHIRRDIVEYAKEYAREKPEIAALWCFGIGFILGWKLKPW
jgi:hypothetical protein